MQPTLKFTALSKICHLIYFANAKKLRSFVTLSLKKIPFYIFQIKNLTPK